MGRTKSSGDARRTAPRPLPRPRHRPIPASRGRHRQAPSTRRHGRGKTGRAQALGVLDPAAPPASEDRARRGAGASRARSASAASRSCCSSCSLATGALLLFAYEPSPERAYGSVRAIVDRAPFGAFVRNIHHWAANGFLLVAFLHLLRVFYTGALHPPRRANWIVGLALLLLVVASNFTGYLLPWDQLAYWAVTIATGMLEYVPLAGGALLRAARGGSEVGPKTLSLFFVLHVALLPILLFVLTAFHFWLVRKAGGVMLPRGAAGGGAAPHAGPDVAAPGRPRGRGGAGHCSPWCCSSRRSSRRRCWPRRTRG